MQAHHARPAVLVRRHRRMWIAAVGSALVLVLVLVLVPACSETDTATCSGDWLDGTTELVAQEEIRAVGSIVAVGHEELEAIAEAVDRYHDAMPAPEDDPRPCHDTFEAEMTYALVMIELAAQPELASPELLAALHQAGEDDGMPGVFGVVAGTIDDGVGGLVVYPGLDPLQDLVLTRGEIVGRERDLRERLEAGDGALPQAGAAPVRRSGSASG